MGVVFYLAVCCTFFVEDGNVDSFLANSSNVNAKSIPEKWSADSNVAWQAKLQGHGQSSPVIWGDKVFLTQIDGPMKEKNLVLCLDLKTGKEVWKKEFDTSYKIKSSVYVCRAAPSPVVDAKHLFVLFESGDMMAMTHDGELVWKKSLTKEFGPINNRFMLGSSLAQLDDSIFVLVDHDGPSYLLSVKKTDGKNQWKTAREGRISWTSPAIIRAGDQAMVVVSSKGSVDGYHPKDGKQLFNFKDVGGNTVPTPIQFGDGEFLIGASPGRGGEDTAMANKSNIALKIQKQGDTYSVKKSWQAKRATSSFGSPMVYKGIAYWVNRAGVLFAFDAKTGEKKYQERVAESIWATPIGIGDKVYFFGQKGTTSVIQAGPEFKLISENKLFENEASNPRDRGGFEGKTQYSATAVGDSILIRTGDVLFCVSKGDAASK